ncbi:MAG TPA: hypothetical protein VFE62_21175, partial [Gemmataceae bacterium]|nr:hypothetical protein [Gemmataceae bacterium]
MDLTLFDCSNFGFVSDFEFRISDLLETFMRLHHAILAGLIVAASVPQSVHAFGRGGFAAGGRGFSYGGVRGFGGGYSYGAVGRGGYGAGVNYGAYGRAINYGGGYN